MRMGGPRQIVAGLHPEDAPEVFVDLTRTMTLGAASKKLSHVRMLHASKDELVASASTTGASLSMHISSDGPNFSLLLEHGLPSRKTSVLEPIFREDHLFENTEEVGETRSKGGAFERRPGVRRVKGGGGRSPRREQRPLVAPGWACRKRHLRPHPLKQRLETDSRR